MTRFVVDSSVAVAWCLKDERDAYARKVEDAAIEGAAIVPALWPFEVANALAMAERRGRVTASERDDILQVLGAMDIAVEPAPRSAPREIVSLARRWALTAYDAAYLHLAIAQGIPIATIDGDLANAAKASRVPVLFAR